MKWDEHSFIIVDDQGRKCEDQSIYQLLESRAGEYGYKMTPEFTFVELDAKDKC